MSTFDSSNLSSQQTTPLKSTLSSDPDMVELVQYFVDEMTNRIDSIRLATHQKNTEALCIVAHQLKGAAAGYGFEPISRSAAVLEQIIKGSDPTADVDGFREQVDELIDLCRRASV